MNQALKINFLMLRKQFNIYGFRNICIIFVILGAFLVGIKSVLFLIPEKGVLAFYLLIGFFVLLLPLADVSYLNMCTSHKKMLTYFKNIPLKDIQNYYLYRKFVAFTFLILFLFFPLSISTVPFSLFVISVLGGYIMFTTSLQRIVKNAQKVKQFTDILKYMLIFSLWLLPRVFPDFSQQVKRIPFYYFLTFIFLFYMLTNVNIRRNYEAQQLRINKKARYSFVKDLHILYILRTDMFAALCTILVISFIGFDQPLLNAGGFSGTLLTSYITLYYALLRNDQDKVELFYRPNHLSKIRTDKLAPIIKFSAIYLALALILGIYTHQLIAYVLAYLMTTMAFVFTVMFVKLNLEKRKIDNNVVSWQDGIKIMGISSILVFVSHYLIAYF